MRSSLIAPLPMQRAGLHGPWRQLDEALREYCEARVAAPAALSEMKTRVRQRAAACHLGSDTPEGEDFDEYVGELYQRVVDLRNLPVRAGLPDRSLSGSALTAYIVSRVRFAGEAPSLLRLLARERGVSCEDLLERCSLTDEAGELLGQMLEELEQAMVRLIDVLAEEDFSPESGHRLMALPEVRRMSAAGQEELRRILHYITAELVPSMHPKNFSRAAEALAAAADASCLPSPAAWQLGKKLGDALLRQYIMDEGRYPESVVLLLWEEANRRSHGQCVAEFLYLLGVRPRWDEVGRVIGLEAIPQRELMRPRVDVIACVSARFHYRMGAVMGLLQEAVRIIQEWEGEDADHFLARHVEADRAWLLGEGEAPDTAAWEARQRVFLEPPADGDVAQMPRILQRALARLDAVVKNEDTRATHMFCSDVYCSCQGALIAAARHLNGGRTCGYIGDSSDPERVRVRPLALEARRLFWGEAVNPWFLAELRGYGAEGAYEMGHYLERLCRWDKSSGIMEDWMYEMVARLYVLNKEAARWMREAAPAVLQMQCQLLLAAADEGRWQTRRRTRQALEEMSASLAGEVDMGGAALA